MQECARLTPSADATTRHPGDLRRSPALVDENRASQQSQPGRDSVRCAPAGRLPSTTFRFPEGPLSFRGTSGCRAHRGTSPHGCRAPARCERSVCVKRGFVEIGDLAPRTRQIQSEIFHIFIARDWRPRKVDGRPFKSVGPAPTPALIWVRAHTP